MKRKINFSLLLILFVACQHTQTEESLVLIQIQDRNGLSETISAEEKLEQFARTDFLASQPYKQVLRIFRKEGKNRSVLTTYHPSGGLWQLLEAKEMRAFGAYREWFPSGKQKIEAHVIGGEAALTHGSNASWIFDGPSLVYNEEGRLIASILYDKGVLSGTSTYYYPSGAIEKTMPYRQDLLEGEVREFWDGAQIKSITSYRSGLKEGESLAFWPSETPCWVEAYEEGRLKTGQYWSPQGELLSEIQNGNGFRPVFAQENLSELHEFRQGVAEGVVKTYSKKGLLVSQYCVKDGKKHGEEISYYPGGAPKISIDWDQDAIHGRVRTWYDNGQLQSQRDISRNQFSGTSCCWYRDGSLMMLEEYENDKLIQGKYYRKGQRNPVSTILGGNGVATIYDEQGVFLRKIQYAKSTPLDPE